MPRPRLKRPNYRCEPDPKSGIFQILWTENRIPRAISTRTRDEGKADEVFQQFLAGVDAPERPAEPLIGTILDHYLADRKGETSSQGHEWACKAVRRVVGKLRPEHLERKTYWRKREMEGVAAGTIIKEVGHLRAALKLAHEDGLIATVPTVDRPGQPLSREIWLSREQAAKLRRSAVMPHVRLFIALALATGARKEAIETLTWDRVDFGKGLVRLSKAGRPETKKRAATVPIGAAMVRYLKRHHRIATTGNVLEWRGRAAGNIKKGFAAAVKRAGLGKEITPHILRHSVATWLVEDGIPLEEVARFIGDTKAMIEKTYGHHGPAYLSRASNVLGSRRTRSQMKKKDKRQVVDYNGAAGQD